MGIAHELITRGWTRRTREKKSTGEVCLMGAAAYAYTGQARGIPVPKHVEATLRKLAREASPGSRSVQLFNDASGRTFDEVLRVAKQADEILDNQ